MNSTSKHVPFSFLHVIVPSDLSPMIWSSAWCLLTYLAKIGSLDYKWVPLSSILTSNSSFGPSICDLGPSNSVWTSSVASDCDLGPSKCDSVYTFCNLVTIGDLGCSGDEVSFLLNRFGNVSSS